MLGHVEGRVDRLVAAWKNAVCVVNVGCGLRGWGTSLVVRQLEQDENQDRENTEAQE